MHYGIFTAVQCTIFAQTANITPPNTGAMHFFFHFYEYINRDIGFMLAAFVVSYVARSFLPFIISGDYKRVSMMRVMFEPYGRIFIQQVIVIIGGIFLSFGAGKIFMLIFTIVKILFDVYFNISKIISKSSDDMEHSAY
jgi:intracellular septation protein A